MTISTSFHLGPAGPEGTSGAPDAALAQLWRLDALEEHLADPGQVLVVNRHTRRRALLGANIPGLFDLFREFRTLEGHRAHALQAFANRGGPPGSIEDLLEDLQTSGAMVSAPAWLERFASTPAQVSTDWALVITTCDRPFVLERLLGSLGPHLEELEPPQPVLLIDDSRRGEYRDRNRETFVQWLRAHDLQGAFWDRDRRARFTETLAAAFPAHRRSLRWLLDPSAFPEGAMTVGQARNLATLLTAGRRVLSLDDDTVAQPFAHPRLQAGMRLRAHASQLHAYASPDALWAEAEAVAVNPLRAHLDVLGLPLRGAFEALGQAWADPEWIRAVDLATHARLRSDAVVGLTSNAVLGDPGLGDMTAFYAKPSGNVEERIGFLEAVEALESLSRHLWRGGLHSGICFGGPLLTSTLTGIDNRQLVPCNGPTGRGSDDYLLGSVLSGLYPQVGQLEFNWALPHLPEQWRAWQRPAAQGVPAGPDPASFLIEATADGVARLQGYGQAHRLTELANHLLFVAQEPDAQLRAYADDRVVAEALARLQGLRANLRHPAMRGPMQADLALLVQQAEARVAQPFVPDHPWLTYVRASCETYADALLLWPQLRAWVRESPASPGNTL